MAGYQSRSKAQRSQLKYKVAIVGLGAIGLNYDYQLARDDNSRIQTHAAAFWQHAGFELKWAVDPAAGARMKFESKYPIRAWPALSDVPSQEVDVVVICTPTSNHFEIFSEILKLNPKLILLEKPIAETLDSAKTMLTAATAQNCAVAVNFVRRFEPGANSLREKFKNREFGAIRKVIVWYAKGLLNNGSHFINLCEYWFGPCEELTVLRTGQTLENMDCEPDFRIQFGGIDVYFIAGNEEDFSLKEIQVLTEKGIIEYKNGGERICYYQRENSSAFENYKVLAQKPHNIQTDFARYQIHTANAVYEYLEHGIPLNSDGASALNTQAVIEEIISARQASRVL